MFLRIKELFLAHESKIVLAAGFLLVSALSFEAGLLKGQKTEQKPIIIEKTAQCSASGQNNNANPSGAQNLTSEAGNTQDKANLPSANCAYVGSKNSNKYHLPTCSSAKRIKPENLTCFSSENEAKSKGYLPDKGCIK